jgi:hypothetical protein
MTEIIYKAAVILYLTIIIYQLNDITKFLWKIIKKMDYELLDNIRNVYGTEIIGNIHDNPKLLRDGDIEKLTSDRKRWENV